MMPTRWAIVPACTRLTWARTHRKGGEDADSRPVRREHEGVRITRDQAANPITKE
jgi:hypothetical protein